MVNTRTYRYQDTVGNIIECNTNVAVFDEYDLTDITDYYESTDCSIIEEHENKCKELYYILSALLLLIIVISIVITIIQKRRESSDASKYSRRIDNASNYTRRIDNTNYNCYNNNIETNVEKDDALPEYRMIDINSIWDSKKDLYLPTYEESMNKK